MSHIVSELKPQKIISQKTPSWQNDDRTLTDFLPHSPSAENGLVASRKRSEIHNQNPIHREQVICAIQTVEDPEIPVNLYDLGLIYKIDIEDHHVNIDMTLTAPNCPVAGILPNQVADAVFEIETVHSLDIHLVFDPPWTKDMMSEDAQLALDLF